MEIEEMEMEEVEVEETEFDLTEDEIDEWLSKLIDLKENKGSIELDVDDTTTLKINYMESSEEDSDEDSEDELISDEVIE